ncbi:protein bonzai 3 [Quercus suber]|uniref:Protein bonzai 3 n=1 Tax=Quercus suber TaxID=58331 RepID=A0AAW0J043_QUESU
MRRWPRLRRLTLGMGRQHGFTAWISNMGAFQRKQDFNDVVEAIMEVGEVIQFYDSNRRFLAWGFGGRTIDGSTCFNLNGSTCAFEMSGADFHLKSASITIDVLHSSITSKSHKFSTKHEKF